MSSVYPLVVLAALMTTPAGGSNSSVDFQVTPEVRGGELVALDVEVDFRGESGGETRLDLPKSFAGQDKLWLQIADLSVQGATAEAAPEAPGERLLRHAPGAAISVRYRVVPHQKEDPKGQDGLPDKALIRTRWFAALGEGLFAQPHGRDHAPATFRWGPIPQGWTVASDLDGRRPMTVADAVSSISVGGDDYRIVERRAAGGLVRVAVRGQWTFRPEQLVDLLTPVIETQRGLWRDRNEPFFVPLVPLAPRPAGTLHAGIGRTGAFVLYATTNNSLDSFKWELAHEHEHVWIAQAIGDLPKDNEALDYWLSEGFADYQAAQSLLRSGKWTLKEFVEEQNRFLKRYGASPERARPNAAIPDDFWRKDAVRQLPYDRGRMAAILWDRAIREATGDRKTLDGVLIAQRKEAAANERAGHPIPAAALFPSVYRRLGGPDLSGDLDRYVGHGEQILLPEKFYGDCAKVETIHGAQGETVQRVTLSAGATKGQACAKLFGGS
jgi:predicted metalloprotease with PDZ domain